jgi:hypothetical protein
MVQVPGNLVPGTRNKRRRDECRKKDQEFPGCCGVMFMENNI